MRNAYWAWGHQEVSFQGEGSKAQVKFIHVAVYQMENEMGCWADTCTCLCCVALRE